MILVGCYEGRSLLSRLIKWETRSAISHVSILQVPDAAWDAQRQTIIWGHMHKALDVCPVWEAWGELLKPWKSKVFKRTGIHEGHKPGTRIRLMRLADGYARDLEEDVAVAYLEQAVGMGYDFQGLVRFALRIDRDRADRWFCSELVHAALAVAGVRLLDRVASYRVSPGDIYRSPKLVDFLNTITKAKGKA
jgi:hypothetical protein